MNATGDTSTPEKANKYPLFHPFIYSVDLLIPVIDLHQEQYRMPTGERDHPAGRLILAYMWLHIAAGWIMTTLLVAALSGLMKRE